MAARRRVDRRKTDPNYAAGRRGAGYERARAECFARETHCRRCGRRVDKQLPYRDPITGKVNRMSKSFGHKDELDAGGNPYDGRLEHLSCNSSAGAVYGNKKRGRAATKARNQPSGGGVDASFDWS